MYCSKFQAFLSSSFTTSSEFLWELSLIILFSTRYFIPDKKSSSLILLIDHHLALFLIQDGIRSDEVALLFCEFILIILFVRRYSIPDKKSSSLILSSDHHFALFLIQYGITFSSIFEENQV